MLVDNPYLLSRDTVSVLSRDEVSYNDIAVRSQEKRSRAQRNRGDSQVCTKIC